MAYSDELKERREAIGVSQQVLAGHAGITPRTIQRLEAGEPPRQATKIAIDRGFANYLSAIKDRGRTKTHTTIVADPWPESFRDPDVDRLRDMEAYERIIRTGHRATLDNRWLWSTLQQSADWIKLMATSQVGLVRQTEWPVKAVAAAVIKELAGRRADVVVLGPGMGTTELSIVRELALAGIEMRAALVELCECTLDWCHRSFAAALPQMPLTRAVGDIAHLDRWPWLVTSSLPKVWLLLSHSVDDEIKEAISGAAAPGDIFVMDTVSVMDESVYVPALQFIGQALGRMGFRSVEYRVEITERQMVVTATLGSRVLKVLRCSISRTEDIRDEIQGSGWELIELLPFAGPGLRGDVAIMRRE